MTTRRFASRWSRRCHAAASSSPTPRAAKIALRELCGAMPPEAALLDLRMGGIDGLEVLRRCPQTPTRIVVLTGHGTVEAAVDAMKLGRVFLSRKAGRRRAAGAAADAGRQRQPQGARRTRAPRRAGDRGRERAMQRRAQFRRARQATATRPSRCTARPAPARRSWRATCTAAARARKRAVRRAQRGLRAARAVRERAVRSSQGRVHRRDQRTIRACSPRRSGGSLFIDEVAELPPETQGKLLRALETRMVRPVGPPREQSRSTCASSPPPTASCGRRSRAGGFREDLYFRLQVLPLVLPPLRERREDILPLAAHLLERIGDRGLASAQRTRAPDGQLRLAGQRARAAQRAAPRRAVRRRYRPSTPR